MEYSYVSIKELENFAGSFFNLEGYTAAITPWRAESQANNPFADPDDIALIYACDEKAQICGYIGAIPARLTRYGKEKFAWNSGWWVKKSAGASVSMGLFGAFLKAYNYRIMFSDMTPRSATIVKGMGFASVKEREGFHLWLRSNMAEKIVAKTGRTPGLIKLIRYTGIYYLLYPADWMINLFIYPSQALRAFYIGDKNIEINSLKFPSEEDIIFMKSCSGNDVHVPGLKEMEWISKYPWLIKKDKQNAAIAAKYHFSSFAKSNEIFWLRLRKKDQTIGLVMLSLRDKVARTQFVYSLPEYKAAVNRTLLAFMLKKFGIRDIISCNDNFIPVLINAWFPYLKKKKIRRSFGVSKGLIPFTGDEFTMQDGMGDYIFT